MTYNSSGKSDIPILILSIFALLLAGILSMVTMANRPDKIELEQSSNPYRRAEKAAEEGLEAALWHIQSHGRTHAGGLDDRYCINGAVYRVSWSDVNSGDSTVEIHSEGESAITGGQRYVFKLDSKIKLDFLPPQQNAILTDYYDLNKNMRFVSR